jgi:hypothetical protein
MQWAAEATVSAMWQDSDLLGEVSQQFGVRFK